jgi:GMP synthase (glutamine-hydrolysing)
LIAKILIVDSAPAAAQAALIEHGGVGYNQNYIAALRAQSIGVFDDLDCFILAAGDCENLPQGVALSDFHGIAWTGSPLSAYETGPIVKHQIDFARAAFESGVPGFGSCWGMQVMSVALGGQVHRHPKGFEFGVARQIRLNDAGQNHPMYQGKSAVFDALCLHQDEVCSLPPGAVVLSENPHSVIQSMACDDGVRSFWGVQYHPEFDLTLMAALFRRSAARMAEEGFVRHGDDASAMADDFRTLQQHPDRKDIAWRYGLGPDVTDFARHSLELGNWLRVKVAPKVASA